MYILSLCYNSEYLSCQLLNIRWLFNHALHLWLDNRHAQRYAWWTSIVFSGMLEQIPLIICRVSVCSCFVWKILEHFKYHLNWMFYTFLWQISIESTNFVTRQEMLIRSHVHVYLYREECGTFPSNGAETLSARKYLFGTDRTNRHVAVATTNWHVGLENPTVSGERPSKAQKLCCKKKHRNSILFWTLPESRPRRDACASPCPAPRTLHHLTFRRLPEAHPSAPRPCSDAIQILSFFTLSITSIFSRFYGVLNVGKKIINYTV